MPLPAETISVIAFASAVRSGSGVSADIPTSPYIGCAVMINMTSVPGTDTVTFSLDGKDEISGNYYPILTSAAIVAGETKATGSVTLTGGAAGSINTVTVGGTNIILAAVPFNASLNQTATDLATAINANTANSKYTANAAGAVVTITAAAGTGANPNGLVVSATLTTITATFVNFTGGVSGMTVLRVFPGIAVTANVTASDILPKTVRVRTLHSAGSNFTYSVAVQPMD